MKSKRKNEWGAKDIARILKIRKKRAQFWTAHGVYTNGRRRGLADVLDGWYCLEA